MRGVELNLLWLAVPLAAMLAGCPAPMATTAVAAGVAAHEVQHGRCVAACTPGHQCNAATGLCEPVPCAGGCPAGNECVKTASGSRCEPAGLEVHQQEGAR